MKSAVKEIETLLGYPNLKWFKYRVGSYPHYGFEYQAFYQGYRVSIVKHDVKIWRWHINEQSHTGGASRYHQGPFSTARSARDSVRNFLYAKNL